MEALTISGANAVNMAQAQMGEFLSRPILGLDKDLSNASLVTVLEEYLERCKLKNKKAGRTIATVIWHIKNINAMPGVAHELMPINVSDQFYDLFSKILRTHKGCIDHKGDVIQNNCVPSSIDQYCQTISSALKWAVSYGCKPHPRFNKWTKTKYEKSKVVLGVEQLSIIDSFDVLNLKKTVKRVKRMSITDKTTGKNHYGRAVVDTQVGLFRADHLKNLKAAKDMFVLSCCLCQRWSDMSRICPEHFIDDHTFVIKQKKTGQEAIVDIDTDSILPDVCKRILKEYEYHAPYIANNNVYNLRLHELFKLLGGEFENMVKTENKIDGEVIVETRSVGRSITSHTARRSGITWNIIQGKSIPEVCDVSGHADYRTLNHYYVSKKKMKLHKV